MVLSTVGARRGGGPARSHGALFVAVWVLVVYIRSTVIRSVIILIDYCPFVYVYDIYAYYMACCRMYMYVCIC